VILQADYDDIGNTKYIIRTNSKTIVAVRWQHKNGDSDEREKTARHDEIHDVVDIEATKV